MAGRHLGFDRTRYIAIRWSICWPRKLYSIKIKHKVDRITRAEIWPFEYSKMAAGRRLGFDWTGNSAFPFDPQPPKTVLQNETWGGSGDPLRRYGNWNSTYHEGCIWDPQFWGKGRSWGSHRPHHSKERCWFPIGSPSWPLRYLWDSGHSAAICQRISAQMSRRVGHFGSKFWDVPLGVDPWFLGLQRASSQAN